MQWSLTRISITREEEKEDEEEEERETQPEDVMREGKIRERNGSCHRMQRIS